MAKLPLDPHVTQDRGPAWPVGERAFHRLFRTTSTGERLSLATLAARAGVSARMIAFVQKGQRGLSLKTGLRLAKALGRSPWWVLEYSERAQARAGHTRRK